MFCKTLFLLMKITSVNSGIIEVSALHLREKCTISCIFVSQEKGKIDYVCIQAILKGQFPDYAHVRASCVFSLKDNRTVILTRQDFLKDINKNTTSTL